MKYEKVRILRVHRLPRLLFYHHVMRSFIQSINCSYLNYYFLNFFFFFLLSGHFVEVTDCEDPCCELTKLPLGRENCTIIPPSLHRKVM